MQHFIQHFIFDLAPTAMFTVLCLKVLDIR